MVEDGLVFAIDAGSERSYSGSGTNAYDLISGQVVPLINGVGFDSANGGSWDFDGGDDYMDLPTNLMTTLNGGTEASIFIWVKNDAAANAVGTSGIIQLSNFNNSNGCLWFYTNGYTYLDIFRTDRLMPFANNTVTGTDWNLYTITTTPGTNGYKLYINAVLIFQSTGQNTVSVNNNIQGGLELGRNNGSRYMNGKIASCLMYDKALTAAEVKQNYNGQKSRFI